MRSDKKLLIENPESLNRFERKIQVWSDWKENQKYIRKHLGQSSQDSSVWRDGCDRDLIQRAAITRGKGRFMSRNRIDFVIRWGSQLGSLKRSGGPTDFARVEFVREPLHKRKHESTYHGFPISKAEYNGFMRKK